MNRRSFLSWLGLAPVAAIVPAAVQTRSGTVRIGEIHDGRVTWLDKDIPSPALRRYFELAAKDTNPASWWRAA